MGKIFRSKNQPPIEGANRSAPRKTTIIQAVMIILASLVVFFGLLEGGLTLFGVKPVLRSEDPFVGFSGNIPLFTESTAPNGKKMLKTSRNKLTHFNQQMFVEEKASDTYRIFCLGGSTTFGRPFNDSTSFPGWLRELLPAAQQDRDWEVINAGGISYASYRVARLMEELAQYQPDLFIIYTGQNEFLEERTYRDLKNMPESIRTTVGVLARTRTWSAMSSLLSRLEIVPQQSQPKSVQLTAEVDTLLENSTGPKDYRRDDLLRENILEHYRVSLERMAGIAHQAGAKVIFVTPASNLKDCSPFKSEHSTGLDKTGRARSESLLSIAHIHRQEGDLPASLNTLNEAIALDPRYAELHYQRGRALFDLGRFDAAYQAFSRANDEDVCPLRALTPMRDIVIRVAREQDLPLVDFAELVENQVMGEEGHRIPGEEWFLDHVHPTIEGHKLLAVALMDTLIDTGILQPDKDWNKAAVATIDARIKSRIDPNLQTRALINLAKVMHWAGKFDDAERLARQGLAAAGDNTQLATLASNILIKLARREGNVLKAENYIRQALKADPWSPVIHAQLGIRLFKGKNSLKGAAHTLFATAFWDANQTNSVLGLTLYQQGRHELAYPFLKKALQQSPSDQISRAAFNALHRALGPKADKLALPAIIVQRDSSGAPSTIFLQRSTEQERALPDGFYTEWYSDGSLKRYAEYVMGVLHGVDVHWDPEGTLLSRTSYSRGVQSGK